MALAVSPAAKDPRDVNEEEHADVLEGHDDCAARAVELREEDMFYRGDRVVWIIDPSMWVEDATVQRDTDSEDAHEGEDEDELE